MRFNLQPRLFLVFDAWCARLSLFLTLTNFYLLSFSLLTPTTFVNTRRLLALALFRL